MKLEAQETNCLINGDLTEPDLVWLNAEGDENLWYVDGASLFGEEDHLDCTIDGTHPNDLGFYRMASAIRPTLKEMLKKNRGKFYEN